MNYIKAEISFDKEKRYRDNYYPHLVSIGFQEFFLDVHFDWLPEIPVKGKFVATVRLLNTIDYSRFICGAEFLIKEGIRTVGSGKVISVNEHNFLEYPLFCGYLSDKFSGNRKQAIDKLHYFTEDLNKDENMLSSFCVYLCTVLDALQYGQQQYFTDYSGHWFNDVLKKTLYDFLAPLIKNPNCEFEYKKWYCLYARDVKLDNYNNIMELCKQTILQNGYKDKALVYYYVHNQISGLDFAIHELPFGYLGDDENEDLELIQELKRILKICYGTDEDFSKELSHIEKEIRDYMKTIRKRK